MNENREKLEEFEKQLRALLGPQLSEVIEMLDKDKNPFAIHLPTGDDVDAPIEELLSNVALASNVYGRVARLAGMAHAERKLAKGRYDRQYKRSRVGRNSDEREANAMEASEEEHLKLTVADAIVSLFDAWEEGARVASESARKILGAQENAQRAQRREEKGVLRDTDFQPY